MNEMNETKNEAESRMNETENNQREENESSNEGRFSLIRKESQESNKSPNCLTKSDLQELETFYNNSEELENDKIPDVIEKLSSTISELKDSLSKSSRMSRLWINYINYVNIVKTFIRAKRIGNWHLYLTAVANMIDLFAATGHIHYAKSARLYLQTMQDLPKQYPWLYIKSAEQGCHSIRRSNRYWAGKWTNLVTQQVLI